MEYKFSGWNSPKFVDFKRDFLKSLSENGVDITIEIYGFDFKRYLIASLDYYDLLSADFDKKNQNLKVMSVTVVDNEYIIKCC